jgi:hypothetical protein
LATRVPHQHQFAFQDIDELVLLGMGVAGGGLAAGQHPNAIDAIVFEPRMIAKAPVVALALRLAERLGIARGVVFWHVRRRKTFPPPVMLASPTWDEPLNRRTKCTC